MATSQASSLQATPNVHSSSAFNQLVIMNLDGSEGASFDIEQDVLIGRYRLVLPLTVILSFNDSTHT